MRIRRLKMKLAKAVTAIVLFSAASPTALAQSIKADALATNAANIWPLGAAFTFLFVALGPLNVIGPFAAMTQGRDAAFKRRLAFKAFLVAAIALLAAATLGAKTLQAWGVSTGALLFAAGAILFFVALRPVLAGYNPRTPSVEASATAAVAASSESELAFSPLAFPTIVTPYGLALLVLLFTLYPIGSGGLWIMAAVAIVLAMDLLAMLCADLIARIPLSKPGLDVLGAVMGVLLVALGVQAVADAIPLLAQHNF